MIYAGEVKSMDNYVGMLISSSFFQMNVRTLQSKGIYRREG